jgi:Pregnancy-associated plasma protein-A
MTKSAKMIRSFLFLTLILVFSSCASKKVGVVVQRPDVKIANDSLYANVKPLYAIEKDKTFMLNLLKKFHANSDDIKHIKNSDGYDMHYIVFPLRIVQVLQTDKPRLVSQERIQMAMQILNKGLADSWIQFKISSQEMIYLDATITTLADNGYDQYYNLSAQHDKRDTCTLYLVDNDEVLCKNFSCARTSGFANVLSGLTNSVVIDKFFLDDYKILVHEFGHYFGLQHTAERNLYGVEKVDGSNCAVAGDRICDTPADPGELYEVYVNYSGCYMEGLKEPETGLEYRPMIQNYMSYYSPCYMREFRFSQGQLSVILNAAVKVRHNQVVGLAEFPLY